MILDKRKIDAIMFLQILSYIINSYLYLRGLFYCVTTIAGRHIGIALAIVVVVGGGGGGGVVIQFSG